MCFLSGLKYILFGIVGAVALCSCTESPQTTDPLLHLDSMQTLSIPPLADGGPAAGHRVKVTAPEYEGTEVFHTLYLPESWHETGERLPIIFEYTGNYFPKAGSTGEPEDAGLGFGLSGGQYIWVSLPYISADGADNAVTWWGNEEATLDYAKLNVPRIIEEFNAAPDLVYLSGFSRGAIAVNYIGLHDDEIAGLWTAFITHDHFDGVREWRNTHWGTPLQKYRELALQRLQRVGKRPYLVSQKRAESATNISATEAYIRSVTSDTSNFTFSYVDTAAALGEFPNEFAVHVHTDRWLMKPSRFRSTAWQWMNTVTLKGSQPDSAR